MKGFYKTDFYEADFNDDLNGFVVTFKSGRVAQTQLEPETNRLHADHGLSLHVRHDWSDDNLNEEEEALLEAFIKEQNKKIREEV